MRASTAIGYFAVFYYMLATIGPEWLQAIIGAPPSPRMLSVVVAGFALVVVFLVNILDELVEIREAVVGDGNE